jgi:hypothetical protein
MGFFLPVDWASQKRDMQFCWRPEITRSASRSLRVSFRENSVRDYGLPNSALRDAS